MTVLAVLLGLGVYKLQPNKSGEFEIPMGVNGTARVYFEDNGVAHILADNRLAGAYALGYVHASDRLWQMEYLRRLSQGRFSEILGNATYGLDESFRTLGFKPYCERVMKNYFSESRSQLDAYLKGVNDYARNNTLPLQFQVFWMEYEDWTPVDSCTVLQLLYFMLSPDWGVEILRDYVGAITEDEELVKQLLIYESKYFGDLTVPIINDDELKESGQYTSKTHEEVKDYRRGNITHYVSHIMEQMVEDLKTVSFEGSNAWVVSGEHTKTGKPIIVNDPHLGNGIPSIWHYSKVEYPDGSFISGATVSGLPFHAIFVSDKIGKICVFNKYSTHYHCNCG